jgi:hypothetical protein
MQGNRKMQTCGHLSESQTYGNLRHTADDKDANKEAANRSKHGLDFSFAELSFAILWQ